MIELNRILYPTDFSEVSLSALPYARSFAREYEAELHCLHIVDDAYHGWMPTGPNALPVAPPTDTLLSLVIVNLTGFAVHGKLAAYGLEFRQGIGSFGTPIPSLPLSATARVFYQFSSCARNDSHLR